jgi:hypothetical protein
MLPKSLFSKLKLLFHFDFLCHGYNDVTSERGLQKRGKIMRILKIPLAVQMPNKAVNLLENFFTGKE